MEREICDSSSHVLNLAVEEKNVNVKTSGSQAKAVWLPIFCGGEKVNIIWDESFSYTGVNQSRG
jgi:hypothetical protein